MISEKFKQNEAVYYNFEGFQVQGIVVAREKAEEMEKKNAPKQEDPSIWAEEKHVWARWDTTDDTIGYMTEDRVYKVVEDKPIEEMMADCPPVSDHYKPSPGDIDPEVAKNFKKLMDDFFKSAAFALNTGGKVVIKKRVDGQECIIHYPLPMRSHTEITKDGIRP